MAKALGRGLSALLGNSAEGRFQSEKLYRVSVKAIHPDPGQPRREMDEEGIAALAESIKAHGVLQPLLLQASGNDFRIVAGERRWRAALVAGLEEVPARILDVPDDALREISLIENIQREDLSPLEIAAALQALIRNFGLTQEDLASRIGWSRASVANRLRLLNLPDEVREMLAGGKLSEGHARALLALKNPGDMMALARRAQDDRMTVRQLENAIRNFKEKNTKDETIAVRAQQVALPSKLRDFARTQGIKIKVDRQGNAAKVVLENLAVSEKKLAEHLEAFLKKLLPQERQAGKKS